MNSRAIQARLLTLAGVFIGLYAAALTISPAVATRSWTAAPFRWDHWLGVGIWVGLAFAAWGISRRFSVDHDPYLLPIALLLTGWGMLTIWRLVPSFGLRQALWSVIGFGLLYIGLFSRDILMFLQRYKYLWLTSGIALTALTIFLGTNPSGYGPRLWFELFGVFFQPSEPLKLLLIVYLAAYLADNQFLLLQTRTTPSLLPLLAPTLLMTGLALMLLLVQRDLGTASVFIYLYAVVIFSALKKRRIVLMSIVSLAIAGVVGYLLFDVIRIRVDAWLLPWADPSGRSYQIVQSVISLASGGVLGRGPGLGAPELVPVSISDFIFTSLTEETGLLGGISIIVLLGIFFSRGFRAALHAPTPFQRYLATGITAHLVGQSILIIGGNIRLLPLTGVTLPFLSYGGSSLVTTCVELLLLLKISAEIPKNAALRRTVPPSTRTAYIWLGGGLLAGLVGAALVTGWWTTIRAPNLHLRADNFRPALNDSYVARGNLLDRTGQPLTRIVGNPGDYTRVYLFPDLSPIIGYAHPFFGQAGLEAELNGILRGTDVLPNTTVLISDLLYGQHPAGVDVQLTLDLALQRLAMDQLAGKTGGLVLLDAATGEILAMASAPTYDANQLAEIFATVTTDETAPLLNRASQGMYQPGPILAPFTFAFAASTGPVPPLEASPSAFMLDAFKLNCAHAPEVLTLQATLRAGCPNPAAQIGQTFTETQWEAFLGFFGWQTGYDIFLPLAPFVIVSQPFDATREAVGQGQITLSPLQVAAAAGLISNEGATVFPSMVMDVHAPTPLHPDFQLPAHPSLTIPNSAAALTAETFTVPNQPIWEITAQAQSTEDEQVTWYVGGTLGNNQRVSLALVLENEPPDTAHRIGRLILDAVLAP